MLRLYIYNKIMIIRAIYFYNKKWILNNKMYDIKLDNNSTNNNGKNL